MNDESDSERLAPWDSAGHLPAERERVAAFLNQVTPELASLLARVTLHPTDDLETPLDRLAELAGWLSVQFELVQKDHELLLRVAPIQEQLDAEVSNWVRAGKRAHRLANRRRRPDM